MVCEALSQALQGSCEPQADSTKLSKTKSSAEQAQSLCPAHTPAVRGGACQSSFRSVSRKPLQVQGKPGLCGSGEESKVLVSLEKTRGHMGRRSSSQGNQTCVRVCERTRGRQVGELGGHNEATHCLAGSEPL